MVTSGGDAKGKAAFEPPPWEREAFDALAARRAAEEAAREALDAAERARGGAPIQEPDDLAEEAQLAAPAVEIEEKRDQAPPAEPQGAKPATPDDRVVEAMLIQLQGEERSDTRTTKLVGWIASAITFALGLGMLIAGLAIVRNGTGKSTAVLGSAVLSIFGLCFMGMAAWVWISTSRSRGR